MVEKGTWNAPTAEEKIVALEARLESTVKNINKKVSFELGKKAGTSDKGKKIETKSKGGHPKTWPPPKGDEKKQGKFKDHMWYWCGKDTGGKCEKWHAHNKPKVCMGAAAPGARREAESDGKKSGKGKLAKKLKVAKAYIARIEKQGAETDSPSDNDST